MISPQVIQELITVKQVLHYLPASPRTEKGWTQHEQRLFWDALTRFPQGPWTTIAEFIGTKSTRQAMTHGQKLRQKLNRWRKRLRRTPAAAAALAEDPALLDDDVKASIVMTSAAMSSAAMSSAAMPMAMQRTLTPPPASASPAASMPTMSTATTASSRRALHVGDVASASHCYATTSVRLNATPTASSELSAADMNYTELLMASLPFATSTSSWSYASTMASSMAHTTAALDTASASTITLTPSLPLAFVASERLVDQYSRHSFGDQYDYHHHQQQQQQQQQQYQYQHYGHPMPQQQRSHSAPATATNAAVATPLYHADDERYVLPQSMVDDLADVLWDC